MRTAFGTAFGTTLKRFCTTDESGQGLVEYALLVALVALAVIGGVIALRDKISAVFTNTADALPS